MSALKEEALMEEDLFVNLTSEYSDSEDAEDFEQALLHVESQLEAIAIGVTSEGSNGGFGWADALGGQQLHPPLDGAPLSWSPLDAPGEGLSDVPKEKSGGTSFAEFDNPGEWSCFTHRSKFESKWGTGPCQCADWKPSGRHGPFWGL